MKVVAVAVGDGVVIYTELGSNVGQSVSHSISLSAFLFTYALICLPLSFFVTVNTKTHIEANNR